MAACTVTEWVMAGHVNTVMAGHLNTVMHISLAQQTNVFPLCTIKHAVTQTVEAPHRTAPYSTAQHHKQEGCGLDSR